jgi:hypothetical protein
MRQILGEYVGQEIIVKKKEEEMSLAYDYISCHPRMNRAKVIVVPGLVKGHAE